MTSFGLTIQTLPLFRDEVLVIANLACQRSQDNGWVSAGAITDMFMKLHVPVRESIEPYLGALRGEELVLSRPSDKAWSMTPRGEVEAQKRVRDFDLSAVDTETAGGGGAELSNVLHPVIPPEFAPPRWSDAIQRLLTRFPFEKNVFCMTRFPEDQPESAYPDPIKQVLMTAREALAHHGLHLLLASDRTVDDELFGNIAGHMWAAKYGIGLLETRFGPEFNDNVLIEVGAMLITGRRVALLKDRDTPKLPTDFIGQIYKDVDFGDTTAVAAILHSWAANDLALGSCACCVAVGE